MKITIVGAGRIGQNLALLLSKENHEVYIIEENAEVAAKISDKLDAKVIVGSGVDPDVLQKANVSQADLVLAATASDETNIVTCLLSSLYGAKRKIARVRSTSLSESLSTFGYHQVQINEIINPELVAAQAIVKILQTPGASEVADFADGKILLRGFDVPENSSLCGEALSNLRDEDFPWPFLIVSLVRKGTVIFPKGDTVIEVDDLIYVLLPRESLGEFLTFVNPQVKMPKKVIIYGASITGINVAKNLAKFIKDVVVLEENEVLAQSVAGELSSATIIHGSASEGDILTECGIDVADVFIATTEDDHANLISSVLAKKMGAKTTIITTQHPEFMSIVGSLDIDAIINPHYLAVKQILHYVRGKGISAVTKLLECDAEALEFTPEKNSPVTRDVIKNIKFPKDAIVGAVYREDKVVLASGDIQINEGEKVIVFCQQTAVKKLQALFINK
ncbi:Trk system potassium uptake protein TrkA [hydrothermal vent metagenome]|uniref:Trk system potassium uptake protein TrkA n=1 Tax=hydrothermal vent metagenome TaxID=652676 RepID=A0A3B0UB63_9ZZZZ